MSEDLPAIRRLFRRLVACLPPEPGPREGPSTPHNDLANFEEFDDHEIAIIRDFLDEQR
jgi:hypothetical protein